MVRVCSSVAGSVGAAARAIAIESCACSAGWKTAATHDVITWQAPWSDGAQPLPVAPPWQDSDSPGMGMPECPVSATVAVSAHGDGLATSESWTTRIPITSAPKRRMESMG